MSISLVAAHIGSLAEQEARSVSTTELMLYAVGVLLLFCAVVLLLLWDIRRGARLEEERIESLIEEFVGAVDRWNFVEAERAARRAFHFTARGAIGERVS